MCGIDYGVVSGDETIGGSRSWDPYCELAKLSCDNLKWCLCASEHVALRIQKVSDPWLFTAFGKGFQEKSEIRRKERE